MVGAWNFGTSPAGFHATTSAVGMRMRLLAFLAWRMDFVAAIITGPISAGKGECFSISCRNFPHWFRLPCGGTRLRRGGEGISGPSGSVAVVTWLARCRCPRLKPRTSLDQVKEWIQLAWNEHDISGVCPDSREAWIAVLPGSGGDGAVLGLLLGEDFGVGLLDEAYCGMFLARGKQERSELVQRVSRDWGVTIRRERKSGRLPREEDVDEEGGEERLFYRRW